MSDDDEVTRTECDLLEIIDDLSEIAAMEYGGDGSECDRMLAPLQCLVIDRTRELCRKRYPPTPEALVG